MRRLTKRTLWMPALTALLCCGLACEQSPPPVGPRAAAAEDKTEASGADNNTAAGEAALGKPAPAQPAEGAEKAGHGKSRQHNPNRLANETSLYLLMHAHNPVDWYPWGEEALEKAKKENKVIFLSIGYSSCHWCHVMERETFLDEEIAALMNENFVCIKVDREERPDVDDIYMKSLQVYQQLTGSPRGGGWPLSMFLTPDGKPFFGGTYFPARDGDRGKGSTGFLTILNKVREAWSEQADGLQESAKTVAQVTKTELEGDHFGGEITIDEKLLEAAQAALAEQYDETYGGFGFDPRVAQRPKFPEPSNLLFLVDRVRKAKDAEAEAMLVQTLERMAMGGIRDHLGGGFHRYSVDRMWQIPHFEKMLYDNGQLASVYTDAYLLTGREDFRRVVDEMLGFVLREMTSPDGAFYSALDAESEGEEGKFYVWEKAEVESLLTEEQFELFAAVYGLDGEPNFGDPPDAKTRYAPQLARPLDEIAADRKMSESELDERLVPIRQELFDTRSERERPLTDTKILTSWNGLMIRGLADAGRGLENDEYVQAAERAAEFILQHLQTEDGRLLRTYGKGHAKLNAYLNDYAFLADGLIALFQATGDAKWLTAADRLTAKQLELFWDEEGGGFFFTSDDHETLLARAKSPYDGAQPSGNSVAAQNLVFLGNELNKPEYLDKAERTIGSLGALLERAPAIAPRMLVAASMLLEAKADRLPVNKE